LPDIHFPWLDSITREQSAHTGTKPTHPIHSSASVATQINNSSSIAAEIDRRLPTAKADDDFVVEIGVGLKSRPHAFGA
jgi:hypothetical protein